VIDPFQNNNSYCGEAMIQRAGYRELHSFLERFPEEVLPDLPRLQFALIDSSHLFDHTILEFVLIDKKLDVGGILALHDTWTPSIQAVGRFILANRAYEICRDYSLEETRFSLRRRCKQVAGGCLAKIPGADRFSIRTYCVPGRRFRSGTLHSCKSFPMIGAIGGFISAFSVTQMFYAKCRRSVPLCIPKTVQTETVRLPSHDLCMSDLAVSINNVSKVHHIFRSGTVQRL
jgi:hypothetical protein